MRVSWMYRSRIAVSSLRRYALCWSLMYLTIGSQLIDRKVSGQGRTEGRKETTNQFSLLIWSPYPGVSTMFNRSLTPFSTMTGQNRAISLAIVIRTEECARWETAWISVVCLTGSSATKRPFESIKWEAKMVLMSVDFPRPVCPIKSIGRINKRASFKCTRW
jgi:hypothetical protein